MALTITDSGGNVALPGGNSVSKTAIDAAIGDWLVAIVAVNNSGASGASPIASVSDSAGNSWTQRAIVNFSPGSSPNDGVTLGIFTAAITNALAAGSVTANFSPNATLRTIQVYRVQPGGGETIEFVAADAAGSTGNTATHSAATVSVDNGHAIFGAAAIETNTAITGDSDTTNGNWSAIATRLADSGSDGASTSNSSQYKIVNASGNQSWACTTGAAKDSARSYLVLRAAAAAAARSRGFIIG